MNKYLTTEWSKHLNPDKAKHITALVMDKPSRISEAKDTRSIDYTHLIKQRPGHKDSSLSAINKNWFSKLPTQVPSD